MDIVIQMVSGPTQTRGINTSRMTKSIAQRICSFFVTTAAVRVVTVAVLCRGGARHVVADRQTGRVVSVRKVSWITLTSAIVAVAFENDTVTIRRRLTRCVLAYFTLSTRRPIACDYITDIATTYSVDAMTTWNDVSTFGSDVAPVVNSTRVAF